MRTRVEIDVTMAGVAGFESTKFSFTCVTCGTRLVDAGPDRLRHPTKMDGWISRETGNPIDCPYVDQMIFNPMVFEVQPLTQKGQQ